MLSHTALSVTLLTVASSCLAVDNGVARLPVLGYNTWNAYLCDINQDVIVSSAQLMQDLGLQAAGYNYVNVDDCYSEKNRTSDGKILEDRVRFSNGMRNLTDQIHGLGFKTGIYSDAGWLTCAGYPGSWKNEEIDANTFFIDWNFDYLKYDNCAMPFDNITRTGVVGRYQRMKDALDGLQRETPIVFSLCEWGRSQVWAWGAELGHSWRTTGDIQDNWASIKSILNFNSFITGYTDFFGHNDMDMLEVGNGDLTFEETKTHFTAWALMKSPLLIGANLSSLSQENIDILTNREILAINQDPVVGKSISPFRWGRNPDWTSNDDFPAQYWSGPSQNGTVFMLLNTADESASLSFSLVESPWIRAGRQYAVRDMWTHTDNGTAIREITLNDVPAHGVIALLLTDAGNEPDGLQPPCSFWTPCVAQDGSTL